MGKISDFFTGFGNTLGGALVPSAYMAGVDEDTRKKIQAGALSQLGLGLISGVGSSAPLGQRLGQAFQYAGGNATQAAREAAKEAGDTRREQTQAAQFARTSGLQERGVAAQEKALADAEANFKVTSKATADQLAAEVAHWERADAYAKANSDANAAEAASMARTRIEALKRQKQIDDMKAAVFADKTLTPDQRTRALQDIDGRFSGGVFGSPLTNLFGTMFGNQPGAPGGGQTPATPTNPVDAITAARRAAGLQ